MSSRFTAVLVSAFLMLTANLTRAAEVAGVHVDDHARLGDSELVLNGTGLRTKLFFKVYVAALYLPKKTASAADIVNASEPRRVALRLMRNLDADTFIGALREGLEANNSAAELAALKPQIDQFEGVMRSVGNAKEGDTVTLDFTADATAVGFNGQTRGRIAGAAFGRALLRVWLGDKPVQSDLKQALLGG